MNIYICVYVYSYVQTKHKHLNEFISYTFHPHSKWTTLKNGLNYFPWLGCGNIQEANQQVTFSICFQNKPQEQAQNRNVTTWKHNCATCDLWNSYWKEANNTIFLNSRLVFDGSSCMKCCPSQYWWMLPKHVWHRSCCPSDLHSWALVTAWSKCLPKVETEWDIAPAP